MLELSKKGCNAFALIYRPGAQTACEDLARVIAFIHEHADELEVPDTGPSAYACVGTNDRTASCSTMERRIERIKRNGTNAGK